MPRLHQELLPNASKPQEFRNRSQQYFDLWKPTFLPGKRRSVSQFVLVKGWGRIFVNIYGDSTHGTLGLAIADLNGDGKLDVVQAQGEKGKFDERVFLGKNIQPDTAPPMITMVEKASTTEPEQPIQVRARIHDNKSPTMPHDWRSVVLRWTADGQMQENPMQWYGEYLWRSTIDKPPAGDFSYQVCARDAAGNEACFPP